MNPEPLTKTEIGVVKRMRALVEKTHWTKHQYRGKQDGKNMYCLVGLIEKEARVPPDWREHGWPSEPVYPDEPVAIARARSIYNAVFAAIKRKQPRSVASSVEAWNDNRLTTREKVLKVLDDVLEGEAQAK